VNRCFIVNEMHRKWRWWPLFNDYVRAGEIG
jgi:hypothetical protein